MGIRSSSVIAYGYHVAHVVVGDIHEFRSSNPDSHWVVRDLACCVFLYWNRVPTPQDWPESFEGLSLRMARARVHVALRKPLLLVHAFSSSHILFSVFTSQ